MASLKDELKNMDKSVDGLIRKITSVSNTMSNNKGRVDTGSNFLNNSLGAFSSRPSVRAESRFNLGMGIASGIGNAIGGATQMMPDISATMDRMTTYYGATLRAGQGMSRNQVQQMTMAGLGGGMTGPGSDAMVSGYLSMRGMMANASFGSTYQETVRSVGGAAKYLNMSNERATAAIEGLTSGSTSASMLRNFGLSTADPRTGKEKTQGQLFGDLYGRLTSGRGPASREQTMDSFRRGALGATLRASGLNEDQQQMFVAYAMERAEGRELDLSDPKSVSAAMKAAGMDENENPNLPGYALNTAKTGAMQNAQEAYLSGIKAVTPVLEGLTAIGGVLAGAFGGLVSAVGLASSSLVAMGAVNAVGGVGGAAANAGMLGMATKGGKGGIVSKAFAGAKGALGGGKGFKAGGLALATGVVGNAVGGVVSSGAEQGSTRDRLGNAIGGAATGAGIGFMIGSALAPVTFGASAAVGAGIGAVIGGGMGYFGEGGDDGSSNTNGSGAPVQFKLMHPTKSANITATFGQRESSFTKGKITWPNGHKGIDYSGKQGDTIFASESGHATLHDGGELGKRVRIKHDNGMYTHYCHLSTINVREGKVSKGAPIGGMGNTGGKSTGVHLHFALSTGPDTDSAIDPMPYLGGGGNYLSSPPTDSEQSTSSTNPTSAGTTSAVTNPGGEDSSAVSSTASTNVSEGTSSNVPLAPGGAASAADGVEAYSQGSHYSGSGGTSTAAAPEGGEGTSDDQGYLSTPNGATTLRKGKNGRESYTVNNSVTINLSVEKGTQEEARRFADMLKRALEDEHAMKMMARK